MSGTQAPDFGMLKRRSRKYSANNVSTWVALKARSGAGEVILLMIRSHTEPAARSIRTWRSLYSVVIAAVNEVNIGKRPLRVTTDH